VVKWFWTTFPQSVDGRTCGTLARSRLPPAVAVACLVIGVGF
jgi:hypothetical protein